ncbi:ABC transporter permease [Desulfopila inferna]|uniref:ABC transporter permease n=1 Tax=Desulfopila inferna TaxID=468528 RepID=UPI001963D2D2|nr:ABC transporter permease subunit [Desulfopila inferna]MBM9606528.1 ABC transporter permease subunit [Desulfopila inferna]
MIRFMLLLTLFFAVFVSPLIVLLLYAVSSAWMFPQINPTDFDLRSISYLLAHKEDIILSLFISCAYSFATVLLTLVLTVLPAKLFARTSFTGKAFLEGLFLAPALIPPMAFAMGAHYFFIHLGIADTFMGVVIILGLYSYPYMLRALTAGYQTHGEGFAICARNIGASSLRILITIELPLLLPAIVAGAIIVFLVSFSEYFLVFLIGGGTVPSYSGYIFPLLNSSDKSVASLLTLIFLIVPIILFALIDRIIYAVYRKRGLM